jgi:acyl transferase domain-containing protein
MHDAGVRIFLEVGTKAILSSLVEDILKDRSDFVTLAVDPAGGSLRGLLQALGRLFVEGVEFNAARLFTGRTAHRLDFESQPSDASSRKESPQWRLNGGYVRTSGERPGVSGKLAPLTADDIAVAPPSPPPGQKSTQPAMNAKSQASEPGQTASPQNPAVGSATHQAQFASLQAYAFYQETMRQFLKLEEEVMRQFLGGNAMPAESISPEATFAHSLSTLRPVEPAPSSPQVLGRVLTELSPLLASSNGNGENSNDEGAPAAVETPRMSIARNGPLDRASLTSDLLTLVSERTGYPTDMLGLELDMEADLGIDSIKRVEILGALQESLPLDLVARLSEHAEDLVTTRTLEGWIEAILPGLQSRI